MIGSGKDRFKKQQVKVKTNICDPGSESVLLGESLSVFDDLDGAGRRAYGGLRVLEPARLDDELLANSHIFEDSLIQIIDVLADLCVGVESEEIMSVSDTVPVRRRFSVRDRESPVISYRNTEFRWKGGSWADPKRRSCRGHVCCASSFGP